MSALFGHWTGIYLVDGGESSELAATKKAFADLQEFCAKQKKEVVVRIFILGIKSIHILYIMLFLYLYLDWAVEITVGWSA